MVSDGADVERVLRLDVAEEARALVRDQVTLGRVGEHGGSLVCDTVVTYAAQPALVERLDLQAPAEAIDPESSVPSRGRRVTAAQVLRESPGMLGGARTIDSITAIGWRPDVEGRVDGGPAVAPGPSGDGVAYATFALAVPGALARHLVDEAHRSVIPAVWGHWAGRLEASTGAPR